MSRSIVSCTGLVKELSRQMAMASTFSASSASTARSASARIEGAVDLAGVVDTLVDDLAQVTLDQRRRLGPGEVVELGHAQGADFQHIAEALGGDQPDAGALVLEDGVGRDGGAVADFLDGAAGEAGLAKNFAEAVDDGLGVVADAGGDLLGVDGAVRPEQHDVGEGAADIDTDAVGNGHGILLRGARERRRRMWGVVALNLGNFRPAA
jgi:hypothetical protein